MRSGGGFVQLLVEHVGRQAVFPRLAFSFVVVVQFDQLWKEMAAEGLNGVDDVGE
jgi:hypothetical protein